MPLQFVKMNGAGNDFLLIDNRDRKIKLSPTDVARLCDRHRGIGADGVILLVPSSSGKANWAWEFFNSDGSMPNMCGNGARCFARYVQHLTGIQGGFTFETGAGLITTKFENDRVSLNLTKPTDLRLNQQVALSIGTREMHYINTGVPNTAVFVEDVGAINVHDLGREIRRHTHFAPDGTNVDFTQVLGPSSLRVRTYERGVEAETLACGLGVTAAALVSAIVHQFESPIKARVEGGETLEVSFKRNGNEFSDVRLLGPADFVYDGSINL